MNIPKSTPVYLLVCVSVVFLWFALRPFIEPLIYDFERLDTSSQLNMKVSKYYQNRGTGYVNNKIFIPDLINDHGESLIRKIRKGAILQKSALSDSLIVKIDSLTYTFIIQNSTE